MKLRASAIDSTMYNGGKGAHNCYLCSEKRTGIENSYHLMGVARTFGRHCRSQKSSTELS